MKHAREDYNRIQDPLNLIPENEPVFLLRGQDILGTQVLTYYYGLLHKTGCKDADFLRRIEQQIARFAAWTVKKYPDIPKDPQGYVCDKCIENTVKQHFSARIFSYHRFDLLDENVIKPVVDALGYLQVAGTRYALLVDNIIKFEYMILYSPRASLYTRGDQRLQAAGVNGMLGGIPVIDLGDKVTGISLVAIPVNDAWWDVNEVDDV